MKRMLLCLVPLFIVLISTSAWTKTIDLIWDPSDEPFLAGYKLYYQAGKPGGEGFNGNDAHEGPSPIDIGHSLTATISGLDEQQVYYFAVTAYDAWGNESAFSNVVSSHWIPLAVYPEDGGLASSGQAHFQWSSPPDINVVSYKLYYGTDPLLSTTLQALQAYPATALLAGMAFLGLIGLGRVPGKSRWHRIFPLILILVFFSLGGCGSDGDSGAIDIGNANPQPSDGSPAIIVANIDDTSYTAHDLQPSTTYYWKVVAIDENGTEYESPLFTFVTE